MMRILFVCMGNICRSPTVQGVFESLLASEGLDHAVAADSAGTSDYHLGQAPDPRAVAAAARRGIELGHMRARKVGPADFHDFDLLLAMDRRNREALARMAPAGRQSRLAMFLAFAPEIGIEEVPDPYFGGGDGFERVLDIAEAGSRGLIGHLRAGLGRGAGPVVPGTRDEPRR